ncbi:MAG: M3 family metallopeptidase [Verrucomicrobiota bacterium]|nr:M3 family metallopeptidase [Verrucomicrobiota bacterium]
MNEHPFLDTSNIPDWEKLTPDHIRDDISKALENAESALEGIRQLNPTDITFANTVKALEEASHELYYAWGLVTHLDAVCNSEALREAHNEMLPQVSSFGAKITLDPKLWQALQTFAESKEATKLNPVDRRLLDESILDFREAGADLDDEKRKRLEEVSQELAQVTQKFSEQVLDATNDWQLVVREESKLKGLPTTAKEAARLTALEKLGEEKGKDAWVFTLHMPSMLPVLQYLDDEEIRQKVWAASDRLCVDEPYANEPLIRQILALRQEKAEILGKGDFADVVLSRRMARNGAKADEFVTELGQKSTRFFQEENQELEEFKSQMTGEAVDLLQPWEVGYWSEKLKKERYAFDDEDLRPYFPIQSVLEGMFELVSKIFGLRIEERPTQFGEKILREETGVLPRSVWHEEVRFYDLFDNQNDRLLGSFYADWHPRSSKRAGAWMNFLKTGEPDENNDREPHLGLICGNLTAATESKPALLTHYEVETVFHEFGHLLHHLCGEVPHRSLNGVNVAWDFVELPSQIMENWCWERESLDLFARHHETGDTIPEELFDKMLRARNFMAGNTMMRQLAFAKLDLHIHRKLAKEEFEDLESNLQTTLENYLPKRKSTPRTIALRFSHLFSSPVGYAAAYYSYKWAEVLDADAFTRFKKEGIVNGETGRAFRESILSKGNSEPPEKLFRDFMGRDPEMEPLLVRSGLG